MASERDASQAAGARYQVVVMTGSTENMEAVARVTCAKVPARDGKSEEKLAAEVEMYSHVVAAEFEVAIIDERGEYVGELDWTRKMAAYRKWMRRHQKCPAAWEFARFGAPLPPK